MKRILIIAAAVALLAGGAIGKEQPPASITISAAPDSVKSAIVARLTANGFLLETDSQFQMVFAKEMNNSGGVLAQTLIGNSNCAMPKQVLNFNFVPASGSILVVGTEQLDKATALCARERIDMNGKKQRAAMASFLADVKSKAEAEKK